VDVSVAAQSVVAVRSAFRQHAATEVGVLVRAATEVGVLVREGGCLGRSAECGRGLFGLPSARRDGGGCLGPLVRSPEVGVLVRQVGVLVRAATEVGVLVRGEDCGCLSRNAMKSRRWMSRSQRRVWSRPVRPSVSTPRRRWVSCSVVRGPSWSGSAFRQHAATEVGVLLRVRRFLGP
jgi:hypothetical protein